MIHSTKRSSLLIATALTLCTALPGIAQDTAAPAAGTANDESAAPVVVNADTVLATVNGQDITVGHVIAARMSLPDQYQAMPAEVLFPGLVEQQIQQTVLSQAMGEMNRRAEVQLDNEKRAIVATEKLDEVIAGAVDEAKVQAVYDADYANAEPTKEWDASHILVKTEEEAKALIDELNNGADFAELAKAKSTGPSGPNGGELGWFGPGMMVKEFEDAVSGMAVGGIAGPIQTQFGWHVIKLNDERMKGAPKLEDVRGEIETTLQDDAVQKALKALMDAATIERTDTAGMDPNVISDSTLLDN